MRILITGGAGMIGSNLAKRLVAEGNEVSIVDNLWRGKLDYLLADTGKPTINVDRDFFHRDLMIPGMLDDLLEGVDFVYHLADIVAGIRFVFNNQGFIFRSNLLINSNVVSSVSKSRIKGFIYVGTACSFPASKQTGIDAPPLREEDQYPAAPESAYGWSKLMGEYEALLMAKETGIPVGILILHNVYGPPCDFSTDRSQVIPSLIRKAVNYPEEGFVVWGSGNQGRAFAYVNDIVDALVLAKERGLCNGPIQIGPSECISIRSIAEAIVDISGKSIDIKYDTTKPEGDKGRCADFTRARTLLGWTPKTSLREGLGDTYAWVRSAMEKV